MSYIRTNKDQDHPYVMLDKTWLNDAWLSWKAKWILAYLISLPNDWQIFLSDLVKRSKDGDHSLKQGIDELIKKWYIVRWERLRQENGGLWWYEYDIYERPKSYPWKSYVGKSYVGKSKDNNKWNKIINDIVLSNDNTTALAEADEYVKKDITIKIDNIIDKIKDACKKHWTIYWPHPKERMYAKHLMSKKFKRDCLDQVDMDLETFVDAIVSLNASVKYWTPINNPISIYYKRADHVNKMKQQVTAKQMSVMII